MCVGCNCVLPRQSKLADTVASKPCSQSHRSSSRFRAPLENASELYGGMNGQSTEAPWRYAKVRGTRMSSSTEIKSHCALRQHTLAEGIWKPRRLCRNLPDN